MNKRNGKSLTDLLGKKALVHQLGETPAPEGDKQNEKSTSPADRLKAGLLIAGIGLALFFVCDRISDNAERNKAENYTQNQITSWDDFLRELDRVEDWLKSGGGRADIGGPRLK